MFKELEEYSKSDNYPFHMPGHKRRVPDSFDPYKIDITEIDGFDDMHAPKGLIKKLNEDLRKAFGGDRAYILVNGSTSGVLTAISACVQPGEKLLLADNSHKSAYDALYLRGIEASYISPEKIDGYGLCGGVDPDKVREKLEKDRNIKTVFITSPTYEGFLSDVKKIADICHEKGIPLIVDSAHGAHAGLYKPFEKDFSFFNAAASDADIVVKSLHKNLPAFTQTAIISVRDGMVDRERVERFYSAYQSTSPSYILMAGADRMLEILKSDGERLFTGLERELRALREEFKDKKQLHIIGSEYIGKYAVSGFDPTKILLVHDALSGRELYDRLRLKYRLQPEKTEGRCVLLLTSIMDDAGGFSRLKEAIRELDRE